MDLLALVQSLHQEAKLPGSAPAAVTGQTGRAADLVRWAIEAWNDIQRDKDGRWKWMRSDFTLDTVADTQSYTFANCTDVGDAVAISRFRAWDADFENQPFIYLVADGRASERELPVEPWTEFRNLYVRASHTSAPPSQLSVDYADKLFLGPTPDLVYRITGQYWKSNQILAEDTDVPEMPADYHMLIVYRALVKYGYNVVAQEILARAQTEGTPLYDSLIENQWYGRFRLQFPPALA